MPNNYVLLETIALTQSAASVTFDNLPTSGYTDLKVVISGREVTGTSLLFTMRINGATTNQSTRELRGNGSSATSGTNTIATIDQNGSGTTASTFGNAEVYIPNYLSGNNKSFSIDAVSENNGSTAYMRLSAGLWSQTAAITSLSFYPSSGDIAANSTFSLYGIAALGTTPVLAPKATGGNRIENDGTYWIHTFTSSGTFIPQTGLTCDYLVVAGGGGGGNYNGGGGGGAGGYISSTGSFTTIAYNITVGAGGASASTQGTNSTFNSLTAVGGGGGAGGGLGGAGTTGGSGGGGGGATGATSGLASSASGQGFAGGNAYYDGGNTRRGGGGGGATTVGVAATSSTNGAGNGGTGLTSSISGSSLVYAAGGGGGGHGADSAAGLGTTNVSGNGGSTAANATNGTVNRGGGGGGGGGDRNVIGAGGSGIVIIRYPIN